MQGEAWAGGGDQGRVRTAFGRRCACAAGAGAYRALLKVVVENVDAAVVVEGRAGGPVRGRAAVRAAEATAATAAMMASVAAAVMAAVAAAWAASVPAREAAAAWAVVGQRRRMATAVAVMVVMAAVWRR